ncbi:MAG: HAD-IIIA family hydrolase [Candidatus Hydrogenedentes bacterium]|nr:HAD-IIIA family hydrolase [Candidatus Hydrogenedentota bacterium]
MKAVIIAGGRGTRLHTLTGDAIPKALVPVSGVPIIHRQFQLLRRYGCTEVAVLAGHLHEALKEGCSGEAERLGLRLHFCNESKPMGTGGALPSARALLGNDPFLALCGDIALEMDVARLLQFHVEHNACATLVVHPNDHPRTSDLVLADPENRIRGFLPRGVRDGRYHRNLVFGSVYVLSPKVFDYIVPDTRQDLNNDVFPRMLTANERLLAYNTPEYLRDVGTVERLQLVEEDIASGRMGRMNWTQKRPAVFLDRDGVLTQDAGPLGTTRPDDVHLHDGAIEAVKAINQAGHLAVLITNQPGVAKGFLTADVLDEIHGCLDMKLGEGGAWLDRIYVCPHHPDGGFEGEHPEFKVDCECRKPKPGLIHRAARELPLDLSASCFIGDSWRDVGAARAARIHALGVRTGNGCASHGETGAPDAIFDTVLDAVRYWLQTGRT